MGFVGDWIQEAKEALQSHYGGYCNMMREMNKEPIPYHSFDIIIHNECKKEYKEYRNNIYTKILNRK